MTDKTLADLLDDIPDNALDWLRGVSTFDLLCFDSRLAGIAVALKRHLPDPPYVPAVGDWVTVEGGSVRPKQPRLVAKVSEGAVLTVPISLHGDVLVPWERNLYTFHPAERPEPKDRR